MHDAQSEQLLQMCFSSIALQNGTKMNMENWMQLHQNEVMRMVLKVIEFFFSNDLTKFNSNETICNPDRRNV